MTKRILTIAFTLICLFVKAQSPASFKYQTTVRDNNGNLMANKLIAFRISLLQGSETGTSAYSEKHSIATSDFGVANFNVGAGTALQGTFSAVNWANGPFFLKVELDINNGNNYGFMGTSQLLSVPYALYALKSANAADDKDKDSLNEIQNITLAGNNLALSKNGGSIDLTKYSTDSQTLNLTGNTLSISRGNSIVLTGVVDLDADPTNEIQTLSLVGDSIKISKGNGIKLPKDNDLDSSNEIQTLSISGDSLRISKSNSVFLPKNLDNDSLNEIQQLQLTGNSLTLSKNGNTVNIPSLSNIQNGSITYATASSNNAIVLTLPAAPTAYTIGMSISFKAVANNTGHVTINLNGLGIKPLFKNVSDTLKGNDLITGKIYSIIYDGTRFQLLNQLKSYVFGSGLLNKNDTITSDFKITNYAFPGRVDRIIYVPPYTTMNYVVPTDSIAILYGTNGYLASCGFTVINIYTNNKGSVLTINQGDTIYINTSISGISIILSKAYVTPVMIKKNILFTVPAGKKLCLLKGSQGNSQNCTYKVNNETFFTGTQYIDFFENNYSSFYPSGTQIIVTGGDLTSFINGYLFD